MAHKKAGGSTSLGRDSHGKRLGVKLGDGSIAKTGAILVRQRGTKIRAGINVGKGVDDTLFALAGGKVHFRKKRVRAFDGNTKLTTFVDIVTA